MKTHLMGVLLLSLCLTACKDTSNAPVVAEKTETEAASKPQDLQTIQFKVSGMTCEVGCAQLIETKLGEMKGVTEASVDFEKETAKVTFDKSQQTPQSIQKMVENLAEHAYKVSDIVEVK